MANHEMHHDNSDDSGQTVGIHGMLLLGENPMYLSHSPMFMAPHNYQVILKVTLEDHVNRELGDFRAHFGSDMLVTVRPEPFAIRDLMPLDADQPALTEFRGDIVKGHFEHGGDTLAEATLVRVDEVTYFQELDLGAADPDDNAGDLVYLLFGDADHDLFLAHQIGRRPSFDQALRITAEGIRFTEHEIERQGRPTVTITGRTNVPDQRVTAGELVAAHSSAGLHFHNDVQIKALAEIYFNEDELR